MAAFDFPGSPSLGDVFTDPSGASYNWNGYAWMGGAANSLGALIVSDTPPAAPANNSLWFESDTGMLFLRYNDGNSSQWVQLNALPNGAGYMPLRGVVDGSDAPAGQIGEVISSVIASPGVTLATNVAKDVTSITLTPGDWDICGEVGMLPSAAPTQFFAWIGPTSGASPPIGLNAARSLMNLVYPSAGTQYFSLHTCRASVSVSTIYYLGVSSIFASGTVTAPGMIWARRVR